MDESTSNILFDVYGDGSASGNIAAYAIIVVQARKVQAIDKEIRELKKKYGGHEDDALHCRILFNGNQRAKSPWKHLSIEDVFRLYEGLTQILFRYRVGGLVVYANMAALPRRIPGGPWEWAVPTRKEKPAGKAPTIVLDEKEIISLCANVTLTPFKDHPGLDRIRFWADPDPKSKINWLGKKRQADRALSVFISGEGTVERVKPEGTVGRKPQLLEAADFLAYFAAKALSDRHFSQKERFVRAYKKLRPHQGQLKLGPNGQLGVEIPQIRF